MEVPPKRNKVYTILLYNKIRYNTSTGRKITAYRGYFKNIKISRRTHSLPGNQNIVDQSAAISGGINFASNVPGVAVTCLSALTAVSV